jgi:hypothetical protein
MRTLSLYITMRSQTRFPDLTMDVEIFLEEKGYSVVISSRIKDDMEFVSVLHFMLHLATETFKSRFMRYRSMPGKIPYLNCQTSCAKTQHLAFSTCVFTSC